MRRMFSEKQIEGMIEEKTLPLEQEIEDIPNVEDAESGTIVDALGLDSDGKLVKGAIESGTKLYLHHLTGGYNNVLYTIHIISESPNNFVLITSGGPPRVGDGNICVQNGINESVDGDYVCYPIVKKVYSTGFSFNIVKIHLSDGVVTFVNTTTPTNITWGTDTVTPL